MRHASLLLALVLALAGAALSSAPPPHVATAMHAPVEVAVQDDEPKGPTKEEVASAVKGLKVGLAQKEVADRIAALDAAAAVVHADVIKAITAALTDSAPEVRDFTLDLLGKIDDASALAALHAYAKKHRRTLPDEPERFSLLLKSAARHGNADTIELLREKPFEILHTGLIRTRILGLAQIRDKRSVEALFDLMTRVDRSKVTPYLPDFQLALNVLLGIDVGRNQDRWIAWWNDNKKTFTIAAAMPKLPDESLAKWQEFWGLERTYTRNKKRGDRGQDSERSDGRK